MSAHTPGPWFAHQLNIYGPDTDWIGKALICERQPSGHPSEANARLMAAAPELLEALKECLSCEFAVTEKSAIAQAEAAIAKATKE